MALYEQQNTLPEAFAVPAGETDGVQVFDFTFDTSNIYGNRLDASRWEKVISGAAKRLEIPHKTNVVEGSTSVLVQLALLNTEDYTLLMNSLETELAKDARYQEYLEKSLEDYDQWVSESRYAERSRDYGMER